MSLVLYSAVPALERLQKMREHWNEEIDQDMHKHDNFLRGKLQGSVSFRRIKHACLLGKFYWIRYRYEDNDTKEIHMFKETPTLSHFPHYDKEGTFLDIMRHEAALHQHVDYAEIGVGLGLELENLTSFLAGSVYEETKAKVAPHRQTGHTHSHRTRKSNKTNPTLPAIAEPLPAPVLVVEAAPPAAKAKSRAKKQTVKAPVVVAEITEQPAAAPKRQTRKKSSSEAKVATKTNNVITLETATKPARKPRKSAAKPSTK